MNKMILEIGALSFCISIVLFGLQGYAVKDTISRSFLVFVAVILLIIVGLVAALLIADRVRSGANREDDHAAPPKKDYTAVGKGAQPVAR
jgi:predicted Na+-dependent transporter